MASKHRLESVLHQAQSQGSLPWLPRDGGHLPEWDVFLLVPILGIITLPQNRGEGHCNPRPFTVLSSWILIAIPWDVSQAYLNR